MSENFAELFEETLQRASKIKEGEIIKGTVIDVRDDCVVVDVGFKSESWIPRSEFDGLEINEGQQLDFYVERVAGRSGETELSFNKVRKITQWSELERKMEEKEDITIIPLHEVRGGLLSTVDGIPAFLPNSLVEIKPMTNPSSLIGKPIDVKILKMDQEKNNILVSRRESLLEKQGKDPSEIISSMNIGDTIMGTVKNVTNYGVFFELGGVDGLLHVTDIAWKQSDNNFNFKTGSVVKVYITNIDKEKNRVSLGLKQLNCDVWDDFKAKYRVGDLVDGVISKVEKYGAFVEIDNKIEGFIHSSAISYSRDNVNPIKVLNVGDKVTTKLTEIDEENFRISLSLKEAIKSPWHIFEDEHKVGEVINAKVDKVTDFGIFVKLTNTVNGIIPINELSWDIGNTSTKDFSKFINSNGEVDVVIKSISPEDKKITLSIKMLQKNPSVAFLEENSIKEGDKITGKIKQIGYDDSYLEIGKDTFVSIPNSSHNSKRGDELEVQIDKITDNDVICHPV